MRAIPVPVLPLRPRLAGRAETILEVETAAHDRLVDTLGLIVEAQYHGAVYIAGYVAEILLKTAWVRFTGGLGSTLLYSSFASAPLRLNHLYSVHRPGIVVPAKESFHSIQFWRDLLILERASAGNPYTRAFEGVLVLNTDQLYDLWWVEARYRHNDATLLEATTAYDLTDWVLKNHSALWS